MSRHPHPNCSASLIRVGFNLSDGRTIEVEKMEKDYGEWVYVTTKEGLFHTTYRDLCFYLPPANVKGDSRPSENQGFSEGAGTPENPNEVGFGKSSGPPTCSPKYYYLQLSDQSGTVVEETRYMAWDRRGNERLDVLNKAIERTIHPAQQNGYSADDLKFKISRFPSSGGRFDVSSTNLNGEDPLSPDSGN